MPAIPSSDRVAVGPWFVDARLDSAAAIDGRPYLSLEGTAEFVREKYRRWQGDEKTARELALTYGGEAVPKAWVTAEEAGRRQAHILPDAATGKARPHRHDRTGEEIEP